MSEKQFSVRLRSECDGVVYSFFDGDKPLDVDMIVDLLNEQQATIEAKDSLLSVLSKENEQLRQSRDYWSKKTKEHIYYWNCLEKAIEKVFDSDDQCFDEIWKHYDEMEAKWEDEE